MAAVYQNYGLAPSTYKLVMSCGVVLTFKRGLNQDVFGHDMKTICDVGDKT